MEKIACSNEQLAQALSAPNIALLALVIAAESCGVGLRMPLLANLRLFAEFVESRGAERYDTELLRCLIGFLEALPPDDGGGLRTDRMAKVYELFKQAA